MVPARSVEQRDVGVDRDHVGGAEHRPLQMFRRGGGETFECAVVFGIERQTGHRNQDL